MIVRFYDRLVLRVGRAWVCRGFGWGLHDLIRARVRASEIRVDDKEEGIS